MPLVHLIYTSYAVDAPSSRELMTILEASRRRNAADGVTGMLVYGGDLFLQLLEGPREAVCRTFYRILRDARHRDVTILQFGYPAQRLFAAWSMNYAGAADAQHQFAHGFVLENGQVYGCTAGRIVVQREGMWGQHYELCLTDERGIEHRAQGAPIASGLWEPYGCCGVPNVFNRYVSATGRVGYGEVQEGWFWDTVLRLRAAGQL